MNFRVGSGGSDADMEHAPEVLSAKGPIVPVTITVPDAVQSSHVNLGSPIPEPVTGFALIDTGATSSCFNNSSALQAGFAGKMLLPA